MIDSDDRDDARDQGAHRESDRDGFNAADILSGWSAAGRIVAARFMRPPLVLLGRDLEPPAAGEMARAARGFPLVGLAIGGGAALVYLLAYWLGLPSVLSAILAVAVMVFADGALCESGLARFADAWIGGGDREDVLAALKDGRPGTYGIIVLIVAFSLRVGAVAWIAHPLDAAAALIAGATASRAALPALLHYLSPARTDGLAAEAGRPAFDQMALALALGGAVALLVLGPWVGIVALAVGAAGAFKFAWLANRAIGGITGSVLGAAQQGAEIGVLLAVVALR